MSDPGLQTLLTQLQIPYPTTAVHIGRRVGDLPFLIEHHNQTVRELEQVLATYLKNGKISTSRPKLRIGANCLGFGGRQVDSIDFYTAKIKRLEMKILSTREAIMEGKPEKSVFTSSPSVFHPLPCCRVRHLAPTTLKRLEMRLTIRTQFLIATVLLPLPLLPTRTSWLRSWTLEESRV